MSLIGSIWQNLLFAMREMLLINNLNTDFQYNTVFSATNKKILYLRQKNGEMAERFNAAVLKTVVRLSVDRGFESLFLRQTHQI